MAKWIHLARSVSHQPNHTASPRPARSSSEVCKEIVRGRADDEKELWQDDISGKTGCMQLEVPVRVQVNDRQSSVLAITYSARLIEPGQSHRALKCMVNLIPVAVMSARLELNPPIRLDDR